MAAWDIIVHAVCILYQKVVKTGVGSGLVRPPSTRELWSHHGIHGVTGFLELTGLVGSLQLAIGVGAHQACRAPEAHPIFFSQKVCSVLMFSVKKYVGIIMFQELTWTRYLSKPMHVLSWKILVSISATSNSNNALFLSFFSLQEGLNNTMNEYRRTK